MLSDDRYYDKLKKYPTSNYKRKLVGTLTRLKRENKITKQQYDYLCPTAEQIHMFCTPKMHKPGTPFKAHS